MKNFSVKRFDAAQIFSYLNNLPSACHPPNFYELENPLKAMAGKIFGSQKNFIEVMGLQNKIIVAGIGPGSEDYITPAALKKIRSAKFLVGGRRAINQFANDEQITCTITRDLDAAINFIREKIQLDEVVVMVSGDPGYYSMLDLLRKNFSPESIEVIPSVSAMQLAFAKIALPWHDATLLSFHGRQPAREVLRYSAGKILGLLTDAEFNSATISKILLDCDWNKNSLVTICARLSYTDEKIFTTTLESAAQSDPVKHCILIVR